MRFARAALAALVLATIAAAPAEARRHVHRVPVAAVQMDRDGRGVGGSADARHYVRHIRRAHKVWRTITPKQEKAFLREYSGDSGLVSTARRYLGKNPTGWGRLWCGRFMAMIAPSAAARVGNPNLAMNWAKLPHTSPHVGAIAVMARRGGGHVGIVSGFDASGNPIIVSGNAGGGIVRERAYPRERVRAWVSP